MLLEESSSSVGIRLTYNSKKVKIQDPPSLSLTLQIALGFLKSRKLFDP